MRKKNNLKKWRTIIIILLIAFLGLIFSPFGKISKFRNYSWRAVQPISLGFRSSIGRAFPVLKEVMQLQKVLKQNSDLVQENLDLQSKLAKLSETQYENEILKQELGFMKTINSTNMIPAAIIGQSNGYLKSVTIDKGSDDDLKVGDAVVTNGVLVGTITETRKNNSDVTLVTDINSLVPVVLQDSRGTGLLRGGLQGITVDEVPLNIPIKKGENVVTSGLGGQIPSGILVGKTQEVTSKEGEIFQKVAVSSPVDFSNLVVLFVVKNE